MGRSEEGPPPEGRTVRFRVVRRERPAGRTRRKAGTGVSVVLYVFRNQWWRSLEVGMWRMRTYFLG